MFDVQPITIRIKKQTVGQIKKKWERFHKPALFGFLCAVSIVFFIYFFENGLGLAYNDARSHLDIGRRVVESLKPGLAQIGSVWLPLPHILMIPTVWSDFMWHSGLSGALQSMIAYAAISFLIYEFSKSIGAGIPARLFGVLVFAVNPNILYLQSTAMTELLLLATLIAGIYNLVLWQRDDKLFYLIKSGFWTMLATLIRYEGWFLLIFSSCFIVLKTFKSRGYKVAEGTVILFATLATFGVGLWLLWNQLIFKDALYFVFGPFSASAQQRQLEEAGVLATKGDLFLSLKIYVYAIIYNSGALTTILGSIAAIILWFDKKIKRSIRMAIVALYTPFLFNVLALYLGHSVLFIQGLSGNTWFNVRYGVMMIPSFAFFVGYLIDRLKPLRLVIVGLFVFTTFFAFANQDAVTIDDARVGSSQKNVTEVSSWLGTNTYGSDDLILISAASHDAIIFSSNLKMSRFIHEGTGYYWEHATTRPEKWARWIVMRTGDPNDLTYRALQNVPSLPQKYELKLSYPYADIYELKTEYVSGLYPQLSFESN